MSEEEEDGEGESDDMMEEMQAESQMVDED